MLIFLPLLFTPNTLQANNLPMNAHKNLYGTGWSCNKGFYKSVDQCHRVKIPENGKLNYLGNGWDCQKGFYIAGDQCHQVKIPENGKLNYLGNGWDCQKGFYIAGDQCHQVKIPENGKLNYLGNGWDCQKGFYIAGDQCHQVKIPENGKLNYLGNGWNCNDGYKESINACIAMTSEEIKTQKEQKEILFKEIQRRRAQVISGNHCETEYKTNANVCVNVSNVSLDCNKSIFDNHYRDCDVSLSYELKTDYSGGSYLDTSVSCKVEIESQGRNNLYGKSDSDSVDETYSLYAHGVDSDTKTLNFSFLSFNEITKVKIRSVECEVEDITLW